MQERRSGSDAGSIQMATHHSFLKNEKEDGIIIGASGLEQMEQNISYINREALPDSLVDVFNEINELFLRDDY